MGGDIPRKLANSDRLTGAARNVIDAGSFPVYICTGSAAALHCYIRQNSLEASDAAEVLTGLTGLEKNDPVTVCTLEMYEHFRSGESLSDILKAADEKLHEKLGMIV